MREVFRLHWIWLPASSLRYVGNELEARTSHTSSCAWLLRCPEVIEVAKIDVPKQGMFEIRIGAGTVHFIPDEHPDATVNALTAFIDHAHID